MGSKIVGATWPLGDHKCDRRLLKLELPRELLVHLHIRVFRSTDLSMTFSTNGQDYPAMFEFVRNRMNWTDVAACTNNVHGCVFFTYHTIPEVL
jgi:hypothetical protein